MRPLHVVLIFAACVLATSSPIIRVKNSSGQKKSYCCYGVVRPFDMMAKAKQGLRALNQVGFSLKQVRQALGIQQKTLEGKLEKAEKKAEVISSKVQQALKDTMKILSDATKKAAAKLGQVAAVTNDLGQLEKDLEETKSHDVINQIRDLINENPVLKGKGDDHEKAKKESKAEKEKDDEKSKKQDKLRKPKDSIPTTQSEDEENAVARSLLNQEKKQKEQLKWAKDVISERSQENKRAFEKTQNLLSRIEEGLLQFKNGF